MQNSLKERDGVNYGIYSSLSSVVSGYHFHGMFWEAVVDRGQACMFENGNCLDLSIVAVQ